MQVGCSRKEWLICSNNECTARICKKCFEGMSATRVNILTNPPYEGRQGVNESINSNEFSDSDKDSCDNNQDGDFGGDFVYENEYDDPKADIHDDDMVRGEIMGTTFLEDYRNSSEDYMNEDDENAEYDEDGDGHFDCGIRECVRRRMDGVSNTDMELGGYPLGDYLTGSRYDSGVRGFCTRVEEGSDGEDDDSDDQGNADDGDQEEPFEVKAIHEREHGKGTWWYLVEWADGSFTWAAQSCFAGTLHSEFDSAHPLKVGSDSITKTGYEAIDCKICLSNNFKVWTGEVYVPLKNCARMLTE